MGIIRRYGGSFRRCVGSYTVDDVVDHLEDVVDHLEDVVDHLFGICLAHFGNVVVDYF